MPIVNSLFSCSLDSGVNQPHTWDCLGKRLFQFHVVSYEFRHLHVISFVIAATRRQVYIYAYFPAGTTRSCDEVRQDDRLRLPLADGDRARRFARRRGDRFRRRGGRVRLADIGPRSADGTSGVSGQSIRWGRGMVPSWWLFFVSSHITSQITRFRTCVHVRACAVRAYVCVRVCMYVCVCVSVCVFIAKPSRYNFGSFQCYRLKLLSQNN